MRYSLVALAVGLAPVCWISGTAHAQTGPSFACPAPHDPLGQLICSHLDLSQADLGYVQAYQALRAQLDPGAQEELRQEAVKFSQTVRSQCGIGTVNSGKTASATAIPCVQQHYLSQRDLLMGRLTGPAAEEAARPLQAHVALQSDLKRLGFLPPGAAVDGVFGPVTRKAIQQWQESRGRGLTGFLDNSDGALLKQQAASLHSEPPLTSVGPTQTTTPAPGGARISDATLQKVASAAPNIAIIQRHYLRRIQSAQTQNDKDGLRQQQRVEAEKEVKRRGLTVEQYNQVMGQARTDPDLDRRLEAAESAAASLIGYQNLSREPGKFVGTTVTLVGKVVQVQERGADVSLRVDVTKGPYGSWKNTVYVEYRRGSDSEPRILENDIIQFYGEFKGLKSYSAVLGQTITIPYVVASIVESNTARRERLLAALVGPNWHEINAQVAARTTAAAIHGKDRNIFSRWGITTEAIQEEEDELGRPMDAADWLSRFVSVRENFQAELANAAKKDRPEVQRKINLLNADLPKMFGRDFAKKTQTWTRKEIQGVVAENR